MASRSISNGPKEGRGPPRPLYISIAVGLGLLPFSSVAIRENSEQNPVSLWVNINIYTPNLSETREELILHLISLGR